MLAAGLLVMEIAADDIAENGGANISEDHVVRAWDLLRIMHGIREIYEDGAPSERSQQLGTQMSRDVAARRAAASLAPLDQAEWPAFALSQIAPTLVLHPAETGSLEGRSLDQDSMGHDMPGGSSSAAVPNHSGLVGACGGPADDQLARDALPDTGEEEQPGLRQSGLGLPKCLMPGDPEVPAMDVGYGIDGASVQDPGYGDVIYTDREIMKKTILRGDQTIHCGDACDSIRKYPRGEKPKPLKQAHWKAVMQAGLSQYRVGAYEDGEGAAVRPGKPRVQLQLPPADDEALQLEYHNRLMRLCGVSMHTFSNAIRGKATRKRKAGDEQPAGLVAGLRPPIHAGGQPAAAQHVVEAPRPVAGVRARGE